MPADLAEMAVTSVLDRRAGRRCLVACQTSALCLSSAWVTGDKPDANALDGGFSGPVRADLDRYDSRFFFLAAVVLFASVWVASYLPARRAMRINPVEALRND